MRILLVEPRFPIPPKSLNHKDFFPIGLLKIATYLRNRDVEVRLVRGTPGSLELLTQLSQFNPDEVWVTSLFTYWAEFVRRSTQFYKGLFPCAKVVVGGIYASLLPVDEVKQYTGCDDVHQGVISEAEECLPAFDLVDDINGHRVDYQVLHASRGCPRKCQFCGTWRIEPEFVPRSSMADRIVRRKVVFYDNNLLMNPHIENILDELVGLRASRQLVWCESQSGFDGRVLLDKPHLAGLLKAAGFRYPRIAWDWKYRDSPKIEQQVRLLVDAGYQHRDIYVFMLYNWDIGFPDMEMKRIKCWEWGVQIADCRYRPLNQLFDHYSPQQRAQTASDYYIHEPAGWTDGLVRQFRRNVRRQNICVRHGLPFYSKVLEKKALPAELRQKVDTARGLEEKLRAMTELGADYWLPCETRETLEGGTGTMVGRSNAVTESSAQYPDRPGVGAASS